MTERELSLVQTSAGGGTRARPLSLYSATTMIPKGMMRVMGLPISEIQFEQARIMGISKAYVVAKELENRDQLASRYSDGKDRFGLEINYTHPQDDTHNNGSGDAIITNIETNGLKGDSLVLSNDNLFELNLEKALKRHRDNDAVVTVLTTPMRPRDTIQTYGLIKVDIDGKITRLIEKPDTEEKIIKSMGYLSPRDLDTERVHVNTAGYIIDNQKLAELAQTEKWIVDSRKNHPNFDMAGVLISGLVKGGFPIYASSIEEWGDFGNLPNYLETTKRALAGGFPTIQKILEDQNYSKLDGNVWIHNASLEERLRGQDRTLGERLNDGEVRLGPNSFIGKDVRIGNNVTIRSSDIEKSCAIEEGADIDSSVVFQYSLVGPYTTLDRALLGLGAQINSSEEKPTSILDGSTIGPQVEVSAGSKLRNAVVFPGYRFNNGPEVFENTTLEPSEESLRFLVSKFGKAKG